MATLEKMIKAFDVLKVVQPASTTTNSPDESHGIKKKDIAVGKKDKILQLSTIADAICSQHLRSVSDFLKYLGFAMETFLVCCDDEDSDVRLMADECLNKTIKTLLESHLGRLQVELYKDIKKNGAARSLRAALSRFADLCHLIRPQKCRPYTVNLLPCLAKICQRTDEEAVQETLALAFSKIMPVLGKFTNDKEIKMLLSALLPNMTANSAAVRRTTATSLIAVCQHSRKPTVFYVWLLSSLLELVIPVQEEHLVSVILGVLLCLRHLIPHLSEQPHHIILKGSIGMKQKEEEMAVTKDQLLQVYELLLYYSQHPDHNVVTAALESLCQLLRTTPNSLLQSFVSSDGITKLQIYTADIQPCRRMRSGSQGSVMPPPDPDEDESALDDDLELPQVASHHPAEVQQHDLLSQEDSGVFHSEHSDEIGTLSTEGDSEDVSEYSNVKIAKCMEGSFSSVTAPGIHTSGSPKKVPPPLKKGASDEKLLEPEDEIWDHDSCSPSPGAKLEFKVGNIGSFADADVPLKYCTRLLCSSFLLTGSKHGLMPDRNVRVSVKALALSCLNGIFTLYPKAFFLDLNINDGSLHCKDVQKVWDVLMFSNHPDHHLKGHTALLLGSFLKHALKEAGGWWDKWAQSHGGTEVPLQKDLVLKLLAVIQDDSSIASKLGLASLKQCLLPLLKSVNGNHGLQMLHALISLKDNPYWLVRVELVDLISSIPFKVVCFLESHCSIIKYNNIQPQTLNYQTRILHEVLMPLLGDEDYRVRHATARAIVRIIPKLFFPADHPYQDSVIALAREKNNKYLDPVLQGYVHSSQPLVHALVSPYDTQKCISYCVSIDGSLSRVISMMSRMLLTSTNRYLIYGCCQALCYLAEEYLVTVFVQSWSITYGEGKYVSRHAQHGVFRQQSFNTVMPSEVPDSLPGNSSDLLSHLVGLLTSTPVSLDMLAHQHILQLAGHLMSGACYGCLQQKDKHSESSIIDDERWEMLRDTNLLPVMEQLFAHLMRLLNIFAHILEEQTPVSSSSRPALPSLPNPPSLSPIKRKGKIKEEGSLTTGSLSKSSPSRITQEKSEGEREKINSRSSGGAGQFHLLPLYMKLYEMLKSAHSSYKISMDLQSSEKFSSLLKGCLDVSSQILEIATLQEMAKYAEEMLGYLKVVMCMEPCSSIQCVRQLLKALFGTNLTSLWEEPHQSPGTVRKPGRATRLSVAVEPGLYHNCITVPYTHFTHTLVSSNIKPTTFSHDSEKVGSWLSWMRRRSDKLANLLKSGSKGDKASLAAHIRLFEEVVIKALKQYTVTSNVHLQCQVLDLLAQLVQLRVNYCLLDSDQIFIGFVIKQFEYIEEGQIPIADQLIPRIFYFLVLLSYDRYHSKTIISVPKIIQLCDGLMASGQPPDKFAIPALLPVVEDLFLLRGMNKIDSGKELDAQREVVVSMLLRLVHYPQVLDLFLLILHQSHKEGEDRWKKLSRQIVDIILPLLSRQQLLMKDQEQLDTLHSLFEAVAPSVFRPVDILLKALFTVPKDLATYPNLQQWMCLVLSVLRVIISQAKEEVVLSRLGDLELMVRVPKLADSLTSLSHPLATLDTEKVVIENANLKPEETFARFLFQVVGVVVESIHNHIYLSTLHSEDHTFVCQQMSHLLLYFMHMFQSGVFRRITTSAMAIIKSETFEKDTAAVLSPNLYSVSEINNMFLRLTTFYPTLVLQWCNILTLLNCDNQNFWTQILQPSSQQSSTLVSTASPKHVETTDVSCCNLEMVHRGGIILLCDYVCDNLNDAEQMTWLIVNYVNELVQLSMETPVQDFISAIHRNPAASGLFIQAIHARCENLSKPSFVKHTLRCLEAIHPTQSGSLLTLLIDKFLPSHHLAAARICDSLACRRLEVLLAEPVDVAITQLPEEDVNKLLTVIKTAGIAKRHQRLVSLLNKLHSVITGQVSTQHHPLTGTMHMVPDVTFSKEWFMRSVCEQCFNPHASVKECARLLSHLIYKDAVDIMGMKGFHLPILKECLILGAELEPVCDIHPTSDPSSLEIPDRQQNALYSATQTTLLKHITRLIGLLPRPHQALFPQYLMTNASFVLPHNQLIDLFLDSSFSEVLFQIVPATISYLDTLKLLPGKQEVPADSLEDVARLAVLCCEAISWIMDGKGTLSCVNLQITLEMVDAALKNSSLSAVIGWQDHMTWVCSAIAAIYQLVTHLQKKSVPSVVFPFDTTEAKILSEVLLAQKMCGYIAELVGWLEHSELNIQSVPHFIDKPLRSIIRGLARLPLVNSFARTPPILWQLGWSPELGGEYKTLIPPPPGEYLQERDVLKQYIYRINLLGWISRQQFEETWMALLGVLSATPVGDTEGREEDNERIRTSCLAVKSITSLLLQTLLLPQPGNPHNSLFLQQSRDKPLAFLHTRCGKKLQTVRLPVHKKIQTLLCSPWSDDPPYTTNTERLVNQIPYSLGQVSLEYLCAAAGLLEEGDDQDGSSSSGSSPLSSIGGAATYHQREVSLAAAGLDIHSCLHFLLDLYSQWLSPQGCPRTPLTLLTEVTRSVIILSDIFMERAQYEWMLDTLLEVHRVHPAEDELIAQYLIFGICKASAVLGMEQDMLERLKKLMELSLKSTFLPTRIGSLYGLLYLLEQGGGDVNFPLLPTASDYVLKHLDNSTLPSSQNEDHVLVMWAVAFYIIENYQEEVLENIFSQKVFQLSLTVCGGSDETVSTRIYLTVLHGLERLLVAEVLSGKEAETVMKLAVDRIRQGNPLCALAALGVMLSCMYVGKGMATANNGVQNFDTPSATERTGDMATQTDPELLIAAMERVTTLFDRIKRGFPFEAQVICHILPSFLMEFFPAQNVLNKVIGEFLSSQQPHPHLMAGVIFQVFEHLHQQSQEDLIQDWVMLSLSNFTQKSPVSMAIWSLTCFFVSATSCSWLRALFPHVQNRMGKMEEEDKRLFCLAGLSFRNQLRDEEQRQIFFSTIQSVAHSETPYADLLSCL